MSNEKTKIRFWERFSYGCGDLGCNIIYSAMSSFLLFYYTDYVHVNAATIGTIMLLSRVFDGITNLTLPLVQFFGNNLSAWTKTFAVFGILAVIVFMITFTGTKERVEPAKETKHEKVPFVKGIGLLFKNKYWIMITITLVFIFINYSLNGGAAVYYAKNILHNEDMVGTMNLVANLVQIGVMFFTAFLIKKIGKRNMLIIGAVIYGIGFALFGFVGTNMAGIITACVLKGVGNAGISSCMFAIVSDTIEYGEWKTGYRTEGLINSASSFGFKVGNGLGSAILGWVIGAAGAGTGSEITFIWIPAILCIGQVVVMLFYHLDKEYDGIISDLAKEGEKTNA